MNQGEEYTETKVRLQGVNLHNYTSEKRGTVNQRKKEKRRKKE